MAWDITKPAGTDAIASGDDEIRSFKSDLQNAARGQTTEGLEAVFPGTDLSNPVLRYRGLKGTTGARPASGQYGLYFNSTRNVLQRDNGVSWDDVGTVIVAAAVTVFYMAAAPSGFTQVVTQNDKALRVVSGGSGGSAGGSNAFSSLGVGNTTGNESAHTHTVAGTTNDAQPGAGGSIFSGGASAHNHTFSVTSGAGSAHSHSIPTLSPAYIDVIICSKD